MARVDGLDKLRAALAVRAERARRDGRVRYEVGFTAVYALRIHEDLELRHANGQARFLSSAVTDLRARLGNIIADTLRKGGTMKDAQQRAGEVLLAEAKRRVPVDTGALRDSGYCRMV